MTRPVSELPNVEISSTFHYDPADVASGDSVKISVQYNGCDAGEIVLDRPEDLTVIRKAIDTYFRRLDINSSNNPDNE